jgi:hypothetical protein
MVYYLLFEDFTHMVEEERRCDGVIHKGECFRRYNMYRETMINVMTLLTLVLVAFLQITLPPGIPPGSAEARRYTHFVVYLMPMAASESFGFRVSG